MAKKISSTPQTQQESPVRNHERRDVNFKLLLWLLALIVVGAFVIHGALWGWLSGRSRGTHQHFASAWQVIAPPAMEQNVPALQVNPPADLQTFQRQAQHRLNSYGWVNPQAGLIQLPVARAMQVVAERGLPQWQPAAARFEFSGRGAHDSHNVDQAFLQQMARDSLAAVQMGQLASHKAQSSQLADLGSKLVQEHQDLLKRIREAAGKINAPLPHAADLKDQLALQRLQQEQGNRFDQTLARQLLADTAAAREELEEATNHLQNATVKDLASELASKLETELQDIRDAAKAVGLSQGNILAILQRQREAAQVAEAPAPEPEGQSANQGAAEIEPGGNGSSEAQSASSPPGGVQTNAQNETPGSGPGTTNLQSGPGLDAALVVRVGQASQAEHELSQLGARQARNGQLADLSRQLGADHARFQPELETAARAAGVSLPKEPGLKDLLAYKQLQQQHGTNFEQGLARQFLAAQTALLQETENASGKLQHPAVKQLATNLTASLKQHLEQAKQVAQAVGIPPRTVEQIVAAQLMAAGAPFPVTAGAEASSGPPQASPQQPEPEPKGSSSSPGGTQSSPPGQNSGSTNSSPQKAGAEKDQSQGGATNTQDSGTGPSPQQLQQQRAHPSENQE